MSKPHLYPLLFEPILKPTLWGGRKLDTALNKPLPADELIGESWELSGVKGNISVVANGPLQGRSLNELMATYKSDLLGARVYERFPDEFPLLIKFIDANLDLSIQVHPDDELARQRHNSFGKTEMWYVIDAEPGATLISGFNRPTSRAEYLEYFQSGRLMELLNREQVVSGDVFFLPAGRVHTIGKGLLIAEIQQTSDITYRIYDFDRVDKDGNKRQLHTEEALDAIDYQYYDNYKTTYDRSQPEVQLAKCRYFTVNRLQLAERTARDYSALDSFVVLMFLSGAGTLHTDVGDFPYAKGQTYLLPAALNQIDIAPVSATTVLETYLPS